MIDRPISMVLVRVTNRPVISSPMINRPVINSPRTGYLLSMSVLGSLILVYMFSARNSVYNNT